MNIQATILVPTFGRADFLRWALKSAQQQTVADTEIFVIGDGAAPETKELVSCCALEDPRIRFFDHPKGPGIGEQYRHLAILESRGKIICYLGHDDLWLPNHVQIMLQLLGQADFAQSLFTFIGPDGAIHGLTPFITDPLCRTRMLQRRWNRFGPTCAAHTRQIYFDLPHGWRPAPRHQWSDLYMWQQFFSHPACRLAAAPFTTALFFPRSLRPEYSMEQRESESAAWFPRLTQARETERISCEALQSATAQSLAELVVVENTVFEALGRAPRGGLPKPSLISQFLGILVKLLNKHRPQRHQALKRSLARAMVAHSGLFNRVFYLHFHAMVDPGRRAAIDHFLDIGWREGKAPSPDFDVSHYLIANQDIFESGVNPLVHFIIYGYREKRDVRKLFN